MHCDQCGKENRSGSKFCRYCGNSLLNTSPDKKKGVTSDTSWKNNINTIVLIIAGLITLGSLFYGGSKVLAYYQVESKINNAKKLQTTGDYKGSLDILTTLDNKAFTNNQKKRTDDIKINDQKFITFKTSFDSAVTTENTTSTSKT